MVKTGITQRSKKQQRIAAELGEIIDEMGQAMWGADKKYIASSRTELRMTPNMRKALWDFREYCVRYHGK